MHKIFCLFVILVTYQIHADKVIVILGSSTAAGVGASTYDSAFAGRYTHYIAALNNGWKVINLSVGGFTTYQLLPTGSEIPTGRPSSDTAHNLTKAMTYHPDILFICLGSNDFANNYSTAEINANFDSLTTRAIASGMKVWVSTPLPRNTLDSASHVKLFTLRDRILEKYKPRVFNFYDSLGDASGKYIPIFNSGDGVHTNNHGHFLLYQRIVTSDVLNSTTALTKNEMGNFLLNKGSTTKSSYRFSRYGVVLFTTLENGRDFDFKGKNIP